MNSLTNLYNKLRAIRHLPRNIHSLEIVLTVLTRINNGFAQCRCQDVRILPAMQHIYDHGQCPSRSQIRPSTAPLSAIMMSLSHITMPAVMAGSIPILRQVHTKRCSLAETCVTTLCKVVRLYYNSPVPCQALDWKLRTEPWIKIYRPGATLVIGWRWTLVVEPI